MESNEEMEKFQALFLEQLKEMFAGATTEQLREICEQQEWNIDECLDFIVNNFNKDDMKMNKKQAEDEAQARPAHELRAGALNTGTVPKWSHSTPHKSAFLPYNKAADSSWELSVNKKTWEINEENIIKHITAGDRVMVLMRGPSGCGKTYMVKALFKKLPEPYNEYAMADFVCSTDSYFYEGTNYNFNKNKLPEAHLKNQSACAQKARNGFSPIIIDNTNLQLWEMAPYITIAATYGYHIEILEPETPWRNSASKLSYKSKHGVPKYSIENALERYETWTVPDMLERCVPAHLRKIKAEKRKYPALPFKAAMGLKILHDNEAEAKNNEKKEDAAASTAATTTTDTDTLKSELKKLKLDETLSQQLKLPAASNSDTNENDSEFHKHIKKILLEKKAEFERHTVDCPNENESFILFRQIYPNKNIEGLWDLFTKCNGDVDWGVDILMQEAENPYFIQDDENEVAVDKFVCRCKGFKKPTICEDKPEPVLPKDNNNTLPASKRKARVSRNALTPHAEQLKKSVENWFQLGEKQYDELVRARQIKDDNDEEKSLKLARELQKENQREEYAAEEDEEDKDEMVKISFDKELVSQLAAQFKSELSLSDIIPVNFERKVDVWLPREMAKEMYLLWVESIYSINEDERAQMIRNDEEIAKELARQEPSVMAKKAAMPPAMDLATHLTLQKLYEENANIPKETLFEVFSSTNNNYQETTDLLKQFGSYDQLRKSGSGASSESSPEDASLNCTPEHSNTPRHKVPQQLKMEELKKRAIKEFEETRNSAAYHARLKFECFRRAQEAIQMGNHGTAMYYTEVSRMHKDKIDHYNHKAANCIMNVHKMTTQNPDLLDLHYLHLSEAMVCLDIFLDRHLERLKTLKRPYKKIFIITGRGLHSAMGVSTIKSHVKARMRERNIRWVEVNPGLLKVKLFRATPA